MTEAEERLEGALTTSDVLGFRVTVFVSQDGWCYRPTGNPLPALQTRNQTQLWGAPGEWQRVGAASRPCRAGHAGPCRALMLTGFLEMNDDPAILCCCKNAVQEDNAMYSLRSSAALAPPTFMVWASEVQGGKAPAEGHTDGWLGPQVVPPSDGPMREASSLGGWGQRKGLLDYQ